MIFARSGRQSEPDAEPRSKTEARQSAYRGNKNQSRLRDTKATSVWHRAEQTLKDSAREKLRPEIRDSCSALFEPSSPPAGNAPHLRGPESVQIRRVIA